MSKQAASKRPVIAPLKPAKDPLPKPAKKLLKQKSSPGKKPRDPLRYSIKTLALLGFSEKELAAMTKGELIEILAGQVATCRAQEERLLRVNNALREATQRSLESSLARQVNVWQQAFLQHGITASVLSSGHELRFRGKGFSILVETEKLLSCGLLTVIKMLNIMLTGSAPTGEEVKLEPETARP